MVQPYPSLDTPVGSVVLGREERREVMGRLGSLGRLPNPLTIYTVYTSPSLLDLSFLPRVPTQPIKPRQLSTIYYHISVPLPKTTTSYPAQCYPIAGLVTNKAKTTHRIRPKRHRAETTQAETTQGRNDLRPRQSKAETTHYRRWEKSFNPRVAAYNYGYHNFDFWISNIQHDFRIS